MRIYIFLFFLYLFVNNTFAQNVKEPSLFSPEDKFLKTIQLIDQNYVDTANIEKLVELGIKSILEHMDPHSVYMTPDEVKRSNEPLQGNFEGVGVQFQIIRDTVYVISTISGGPSEQVGIMPGDKIVEVDREEFVGAVVTNTSVAKKLRGKKGTIVIVGIVRGKSKDIIEFEITRDKIPIYSVDAAFMINETVGYIKVNRFSHTTISEFTNSIYKLNELNMESLILDLRGNSGGFLRTAIELTDQFFEKDKLIVYTEGNNAVKEQYNSTSKGTFKSGNLVVLIDHGSASASEILAGAVQDWDRGVIIGRRSYGKGLVQKPFNYPDGSAVRLTTARYYTPTGRCIQKPYDDDKKLYLMELNNRLEEGEFVSIDSVSFPDSLMYQTPSGRHVYGGGGIMPDVFVPIDTTRIGDFFVQLSSKNMFNLFIVDFMENNRNMLLEKFSSVDDLKQYLLNKQDSILNELLLFVEKQDVEHDGIDESSKAFLGYFLSAQISRNAFDLEAYFRVIIDIDEEVKRALEVLETEEYKKILRN